MEWPMYILDMIVGFQKSQVIFTTTELGLYDLLEGSDRALTVEDICSVMKTNFDATRRLLDLTAALRLINKDTSCDPAVYSNTSDSSVYLTTTSSRTLLGCIGHVRRIQQPLHQHLTSAIRDGTNKHAVGQSFGVEFSSLSYASMYHDGIENKDLTLRFMHDIYMRMSPPLAKAFDLSSFKTMCDIGGSTGAVAYGLAAMYEQSSVTVVELPSVVESAKIFATDETRRLPVTFTSCDIFQEDFPESELYIFARVIHYWDEEKAGHLLQNAFKSLKSGGGVLLVEVLINEAKTGPLHSLMYDIAMLMEMSGKERTASEYQQLLERNGFVDFKCKEVQGPITLHAMLAVKP